MGVGNCWMASFKSSRVQTDTIFSFISGVPFPKNFQQVCKKILSRLFRVFVHVYIHHFDSICNMGAEAHVNTCYKHYYYFISEFSLIDQSELEPLVRKTCFNMEATAHLQSSLWVGTTVLLVVYDIWKHLDFCYWHSSVYPANFHKQNVNKFLKKKKHWKLAVYRVICKLNQKTMCLLFLQRPMTEKICNWKKMVCSLTDQWTKYLEYWRTMSIFDLLGSHPILKWAMETDNCDILDTLKLTKVFWVY